MPARDGSGPEGRGSKTGRGLGLCDGEQVVNRGAGRGMRNRNGQQSHIGRRFNMNLSQKSGTTEEQKET
jgi:hypothetical protein